MKLIFILIILSIFDFDNLNGQTLPFGTCGIVNIYDDFGNRKTRVYFCNNGLDPYPTKQGLPVEDNIFVSKDESEAYEQVDAFFPNPTTGKVFIRLSQPMLKGIVSVTDNLGKTVIRFNGKGSHLEIDLSSFPAGFYYLRIEEKEKVITKKIVKQ